MPREKKLVESSLQNKGFEIKQGDHHYFIYRFQDGTKSRAFTKTSHTPKMKDIPDNLLSQMAHQCRVTKTQFLELVDCPMTRDKYEELLRKQEST